MRERQTPRAPAARSLPTARASLDEQFTIVRAISLADGPFTARELAAATGLATAKAQLTMAFWRTCGLADKAPGRGVYRPTRAATAMAPAWRDSDSQGRLAVRELLRAQWFTKSARGRLAEGTGLREGVVTRLMRLAQVGNEYRLEVNMLVDLMVEVGMLVPQSDGYLSWHEGHTATLPPPREGTEWGNDESEPTKEARAASAGPKTSVPQPRTPAHEAAATAGVEDLVALLNHPVQLADLARLSPEDLMQLHSHLAGLAIVATKLRSHPSTNR